MKMNKHNRITSTNLLFATLNIRLNVKLTQKSLLCMRFAGSNSFYPGIGYCCIIESFQLL